MKKHGVQTYPMKGVNEDADDAKINDVLRVSININGKQLQLQRLSMSIG